MTTGEKLKQLREEKHVSQEQAAKDLCISQSALALYESDTRNPRDDVKVMLCNYYGVGIMDVFYQEA